jgi:ATPase subunit of ABC transporter with duplicated ATPase domains
LPALRRTASRLLLLDEPTNNLDPGSRAAVAEGLHG